MRVLLRKVAVGRPLKRRTLAIARVLWRPVQLLVRQPAAQGSDMPGVAGELEEPG